jgi:hypothetical protein
LPRFIFNKDASADKLNEAQPGQSNWLSRKNAFDEEDDDYTKLPDENMVVASWINDMGYNHKEFDVGLLNLTPCPCLIG